MGKIKQVLLNNGDYQDDIFSMTDIEYLNYVEHKVYVLEDAIKRNCLNCLGYERASKEAIKSVQDCRLNKCPMYEFRYCVTHNNAEVKLERV